MDLGEVEICREVKDGLLYFSVLGFLLCSHAFPVDVRAVKIPGDDGIFFPSIARFSDHLSSFTSDMFRCGI